MLSVGLFNDFHRVGSGLTALGCLLSCQAKLYSLGLRVEEALPVAQKTYPYKELYTETIIKR